MSEDLMMRSQAFTSDRICRCCLCGGAAHVVGARSLGSVADLELDAVAFAQVVDAFTVDRALVEEVVLTLRVLDEAEALVYA